MYERFQNNVLLRSKIQEFPFAIDKENLTIIPPRIRMPTDLSLSPGIVDDLTVEHDSVRLARVQDD